MKYTIQDEKFVELRKYFNVHGHYLVPTRSGTLGMWVVNQRKRNKNLSKNQIGKLNEINFVLNVFFSWNERYAELRKYFNLHGHCRVPVKCGMLGKWVLKQRQTRIKLSTIYGTRIQFLFGRSIT